MRKWIPTILIVLLLAGCGTKFVYHHIDWFIIDYLEDYVSLSDQQEDFVSERIAYVSQWYQGEELNNYVKHFDSLISMDPRSLTAEQLQEHRDWIYLHYQRLVTQFFPDIYPLANGLNDKQVGEFLEGVEERHQEYADKYQDLTEQETREKYRERITERMEEWLGDLTKEQQSFVAQWSEALQITADDWIYYQTNLRSQLAELLSFRHDKTQFEPLLKQLLFNPETDYSPVLKAKLNYNQQASNQYILKIVHSCTEQQIEHFRQTVSEWRGIANDLLVDYQQTSRVM